MKFNLEIVRRTNCAPCIVSSCVHLLYFERVGWKLDKLYRPTHTAPMGPILPRPWGWPRAWVLTSYHISKTATEGRQATVQGLTRHSLGATLSIISFQLCEQVFRSCTSVHHARSPPAL